jgi:hypothetical protein
LPSNLGRRKIAVSEELSEIGNGRAPQVRGVVNVTEPEAGVEQRVDDAHWSLERTLARIIYRTEQAFIVNNDGSGPCRKAAIRDLLSALRSGKLKAHGMFEGEQIPHPIDTAVWCAFEVVVKPTMVPGYRAFFPSLGTPIVIARRMGPPQTRLLGVTVPAAKVRQLWLVAKRNVAAETGCQKYLIAEMMRSPDRAPRSKADFLADCQARFPCLSARGFDWAWADAIKRTDAVCWSKAGPRGKSSY